MDTTTVSFLVNFLILRLAAVFSTLTRNAYHGPGMVGLGTFSEVGCNCQESWLAEEVVIQGD